MQFANINNKFIFNYWITVICLSGMLYFSLNVFLVDHGFFQSLSTQQRIAKAALSWRRTLAVKNATSESTASNAGDNTLVTRRETEKTVGYELSKAALKICQRNKWTIEKNSRQSLITARKEKIMYCPMEKTGTTFWRRVMFMFTSEIGYKYKHPFDVPILPALEYSKKLEVISPITFRNKKHVKGKLHISQTNLSRYTESFKFLFVRDPYSRLVSAYVDKLVPPNPIYWKLIGVPAKAVSGRRGPCGHDVTFEEFVKYVIISKKRTTKSDPHFIDIFSNCNPCYHKYDFIGKMESFIVDSIVVLNRMNLTSAARVLEDGSKNLVVDDAMKDSLTDALSSKWKQSTLKCMSWDKALRRLWLKLQMRGLVGMSQQFPLTKDQIDDINSTQFIEIARQARQRSSKEEMVQQKRDFAIDFLRSVKLETLENFRQLYIKDFKLFGYDDRPRVYFDRKTDFKTRIHFNKTLLN